MATPASLPSTPPRRHFLQRSLRHGTWLAASAGLPALALPRRALAAAPHALDFWHTHTHERLTLPLLPGAALDAPAQGALDRFLRDHHSGSVGAIDPGLVLLLQGVQALLGGRALQRPWEVISAYRDPATNQRLRERGGGGVARRSLHMDGRAIDVRLAGVPLPELRDAALSLRAGGVGFYPGERFVHLDTGRVRAW